ncbi:MAG TPA: hypothetical protein DCL38_08495 [Lachnospiraceae bacterium]|nr:hypothetical protein [Lachnospiraceae bacterium]
MEEKYRILIADDEPLVQIGLKTMLSELPEYEVVGNASNGKEALRLIGELHPDILISDIKMPVMNGLELMEEASKRFGSLPVFIMLTAYEDFEMARRALSGDAADYLVKIELSRGSLKKALERAAKKVLEHSEKREREPMDMTKASLDGFRQKFLVRLLNHVFTDRASFQKQADDNRMDFSFNRYIVVYGALGIKDIHDDKRLLTLYTSSLNMAGGIAERYAPCYRVTNDPYHFTFIFYFEENTAVADAMEQIVDALGNAIDMIESYFSVELRFGIGTAVSDPLDIHTSFEEAKAAADRADKGSPVRLFSHIVGSNRRSGKDRLIASIQKYIEENLNGRLQLNEVAEVFGLSPAYLSSIFKKNAEIGFSEFVNTKKIEKAKELLLNRDMKIYEVSDALGFESSYYFSRVFKKVEGMSPRDYINSKLQSPGLPPDIV